MLFNSFEFIFLFVPLVFVGYFWLASHTHRAISKLWLVLGSLFFYSYWEIKYLPLILTSIIVNYFLGYLIGKFQHQKKLFLILGIVFNLLLLGYYKYFDFFIKNINWLLGTQFPLFYLVLPLGISFFTFQQIAYLVDTYKRETKEYRFVDYALFVSFFPQLIAGPIVHHKEMMPQFENENNLKIQYQNLALGLFIFSIGLFKKVVFADTLGQLADAGYSQPHGIRFIDAWLVSTSFVLQIYFDFSGYSDMAVGLGRMFNIHILWNFDSPFKAKNIQDTWRRWHVSLSRFLRDYVYIPLGGSKVSEFRTNLNLFLTFVIGGVWHGAGWTFVIWGALVGLGIVFHKIWQKNGGNLPSPLDVIVNFVFFVLSSVFFRAPDLEVAFEILKGMLGLNGIILPEEIKGIYYNPSLTYHPLGSIFLHRTHTDIGLYFVVALFVVFFTPNSREWAERFRPNWFFLLFTLILFFYSVVNLLNVTKFIYFNF
ncbi:MAG: MBOAT family protein [Leptospiraceae bacterium]|nr:MBOAT family protein [Leptospiraceae bacterium]MDW7977117.1 MBOAT family O-acyltransferase [Leptospiraceae bacterium]